MLQIVDMGLFDPLAILFLLGAGLSLYAIWVVLRHPTALGDEPSEEMKSSAAPPRSSGDAPEAGTGPGI
jgi:hypothetical protein